MKPRTHLLAALCCAASPACSLLSELPEQPVALADMEEPLDLRAEPDDEAARAALPAGTFSGLYLRDARETLEAKLNEPEAVIVDRVVENSPAAAAGQQRGDLVLEVEVDGGAAQELGTVSQWRQIELTARPGAEVALLVDRAGREAETALTLVARARPAARVATARSREEQRLGVVVRAATEGEARAAGLGPGAGAVLVGMSANSPWRSAGLRFGDLVAAVDGAALTHPQKLLTAARDADGGSLEVTFWRDGEARTVSAALTQRRAELTEVRLPLLFQYESARERSSWSVLYGLVGYRSTRAAWRLQLLWVIGIGGGDADELLEAGS